MIKRLKNGDKFEFIPSRYLNDDEPVTLTLTYCGNQKVQYYADLIKKKMGKRTNDDRFRKVCQNIQKLQFVENCHDIKNYYDDQGNLSSDAEYFYNNEPFEEIKETIEAMENPYTIDEDQKKIL